MSRLEFDAVGEKEYRYGVSHTVLYLQENDGTYPKGVVWNGITGINQNPSGADENAVYADNIKYASMIAAEEFGCGIEALFYPPEFGECDGEKSVMKGVYVGMQKRRPFGLSWRTELGSDVYADDDEAYELHLAWNLKAKPSTHGHKTINTNVDAESNSWDCSSTPTPVKDMKPTAHIRINTKEFADKEKIKALEDILYGTESTEAHLPSPDEVFAILKGEAA